MTRPRATILLLALALMALVGAVMLGQRAHSLSDTPASGRVCEMEAA